MPTPPPHTQHNPNVTPELLAELHQLCRPATMREVACKPPPPPPPSTTTTTMQGRMLEHLQSTLGAKVRL